MSNEDEVKAQEPGKASKKVERIQVAVRVRPPLTQDYKKDEVVY